MLQQMLKCRVYRHHDKKARTKKIQNSIKHVNTKTQQTLTNTNYFFVFRIFLLLFFIYDVLNRVLSICIPVYVCFGLNLMCTKPKKRDNKKYKLILKKYAQNWRYWAH